MAGQRLVLGVRVNVYKVVFLLKDVLCEPLWTWELVFRRIDAHQRVSESEEGQVTESEEGQRNSRAPRFIRHNV